MISIQEISDIRDKVRKVLTKKRYEHTLGVAYTAACMAFLYNEDPFRAEMAGLLHDSAKCLTFEEQIKMCSKAGISLTDEELKAPKTIHAVLGAELARSEYGIEDEDILNAIRYHTTGRPCMSVLEKIIFIADYIEPMRDFDDIPELSELRRLAFRDLDECLYRGISLSIENLNSRGLPVVSDTMSAFEYYKMERSL